MAWGDTVWWLRMRQGLHNTQVRHHTQIDLLTCRVCFFKHMMISTQEHHHTYLDLTTWSVCSVKPMMIMCQYFPRLWYDPSGMTPTHCKRMVWYDPYPLQAHGLGLCLFLVRWSVMCCQDGCLMAFAKGSLPEEYLSHNFDGECLGGH